MDNVELSVKYLSTVYSVILNLYISSLLASSTFGITHIRYRVSKNISNSWILFLTFILTKLMKKCWKWIFYAETARSNKCLNGWTDRIFFLKILIKKCLIVILYDFLLKNFASYFCRKKQTGKYSVLKLLT